MSGWILIEGLGGGLPVVRIESGHSDFRDGETRGRGRREGEGLFRAGFVYLRDEDNTITLGSRLNTGKSERGGRNAFVVPMTARTLVSNVGGGGLCPLGGNDWPGPRLGS